MNHAGVYSRAVKKGLKRFFIENIAGDAVEPSLEAAPHTGRWIKPTPEPGMLQEAQFLRYSSPRNPVAPVIRYLSYIRIPFIGRLRNTF